MKMTDLDRVLCFARNVVEKESAEAEGEDVYRAQAAIATIIRAANELEKFRSSADRVKKIMSTADEQWAGSGWMGERHCIYCGSPVGKHSNDCEYKQVLDGLPS